MERQAGRNGDEKMLTMGSLFDGIGGFPLAAIHNGITPVWASEIEPFPIRVTRLHFPDMEHVGDITKLDGGRLPPVDIICGGSPCQDLSVAGQRRGLAGERSGLFVEQVRIVKEMRNTDARRGIPDYLSRPRYLVWENVPGAFSSAGGEDFRAVIEEIVRIKDSTCHVPRPDSGRWGSAGAVILGREFSLAWRVLDAQYWGVPQRRRRIFLVADFGSLTAPQILFKQDSLYGDIAESEGQRKRITQPASVCTGAAGGTGGNEAERSRKITCLCLNDQGGERMDVSEDVTATLRASMNQHQPLVFENHRKDSRYTGPLNVAPTMSASYGTGGNNVPLVAEAPESYCIAGNIIDRKVQNGGNGLGVNREASYTLTSTDRHAVFSRQSYDELIPNQVASTQSARQYKDATDLIMDVAGLDCRNGMENGNISGTLQSGSSGSSLNAIHPVRTGNLIRRLTPLECERLQGFPDRWTDIPGASDSARYRALGNSVAIPCVDFVMRGIAYFLNKNARH